MASGSSRRACQLPAGLDRTGLGNSDDVERFLNLLADLLQDVARRQRHMAHVVLLTGQVASSVQAQIKGQRPDITPIGGLGLLQEDLLDPVEADTEVEFLDGQPHLGAAVHADRQRLFVQPRRDLLNVRLFLAAAILQFEACRTRQKRGPITDAVPGCQHRRFLFNGRRQIVPGANEPERLAAAGGQHRLNPELHAPRRQPRSRINSARPSLRSAS